MVDIEEETLIEKLSSEGVFTHTFIRMYEMPYLYTPFESITNAGTEESVRKALVRKDLVSLKGTGGSGKTCVAQHVFLTPKEDYFPIVLSPMKENVVSICSSQEEFTRFALEQVFNAVSKFTDIDKETKQLVRDALSKKISFVDVKKKLSLRIGIHFSILPFLPLIKPELASDLGTYVQKSLEEKVYNTQRIKCIQRLCETIEEYNIVPVFLIDDTDKFLKHPDLDLSDLVPKFFGLIVPMLSKLECPCIIAAHTYYEQSPSYKECEKNVFDCKVTIPDVRYEALTQIVEKRIQSVEKVSWNEVFDDNTMNLIYRRYRKTGKLRDPMLLCKLCVDWASQNHVEKISDSVLASVLLED